MNGRELTVKNIAHLCTGAMFVSCTIERDGCLYYRDLAIELLQNSARAPLLIAADQFDPAATTAAIGFVNMGFMISEVIPVGDEFETALSMLQDRLTASVAGIYPLAAASLNAMVPVYVAMRSGIPLIDVDPMGRVFPLLSLTTLALAGLSAGPIGLSGVTGESAVVDVRSPFRAERIVRALAGEMGGWVATASYPVTADALVRFGVLGSVSRLIEIGQILDASRPTQTKYAALSTLLGIRRVIRARVVEVEGLSGPTGPSLPDRPSSVTLVDELQGRIIRLEMQNEIQLMLVDGDIHAGLPDIITLTRPEDAAVAGLEDLWVGNKLDIISFPAAPQWYTPEGQAIVEPATRLPADSRRTAR